MRRIIMAVLALTFVLGTVNVAQASTYVAGTPCAAEAAGKPVDAHARYWSSLGWYRIGNGEAGWLNTDLALSCWSNSDPI